MYFMALVKSQAELAKVCEMEKQKSPKLVTTELCAHLKAGLCLHHPVVFERNVALGLCKWLIGRADKLTLFHKIEKKIQGLQHKHLIIDGSNRTFGL
jgi:hypothetical protein